MSKDQEKLSQYPRVTLCRSRCTVSLPWFQDAPPPLPQVLPPRPVSILVRGGGELPPKLSGRMGVQVESRVLGTRKQQWNFPFVASCWHMDL